ncbi:MAG: gamma-glutamyltransferase [Gemmatimonadota bacterium]
MRLAFPIFLGLGLLAGCPPPVADAPDVSAEPSGAETSRAERAAVSTRETFEEETSGLSQERTAQGTEYMVAGPTVGAMEAGRTILEQGGNAIDAAAATAFALMVTDPLMASVGGRAQILIRLNDGTFVGIDGATQAPLRVDEPANLGHGYGTVPIPGSPAALEEMLQE